MLKRSSTPCACSANRCLSHSGRRRRGRPLGWCSRTLSSDLLLGLGLGLNGHGPKLLKGLRSHFSDIVVLIVVSYRAQPGDGPMVAHVRQSRASAHGRLPDAFIVIL